MLATPFEKIKKTLSNKISLESLNLIPEKWEKIGDILIIKLNKNLHDHSKIIGETYCEILNCKTALNDIGGITGIYREPKIEVIYGSSDTETIHIENGIRYKLDAQKIMFSSGNMDERIRMANISKKKETIVDLFAGVGYFTLPIAVYSKPKKIMSCEINPIAYDYLCKNIALNHVASTVEPLLGDNRKIAPKNIAERVIMGYFNENEMFLPTAFGCLKNNTGIIHYHDICPDSITPEKSLKKIKKSADKYKIKIDLLKFKVIKSYAPGISHIVLDIRVDNL